MTTAKACSPPAWTRARSLFAAKRISLFVCLAAVASCDACRDAIEPEDVRGFEPSEAHLLSTGSPTKDEDPTVLRARDGRMFVAWFSDRGGNPDIYLTSTRDGRTWDAPIRITSDPGGDFYPSLIQDKYGTFHMVWFRWTALNQGNIWYNSSEDGVTWRTSTEVKVTQAVNVDDWVPSIVETADGKLLVFFASQRRWPAATPTYDLYVAVKRPESNTWDAVVGVPGVSTPTHHENLPVAARTGDRITLVWVRHDLSQTFPWVAAKSDLYYATSLDGMTYTSPRQITNDAGNVVNVFPALYEAQAGGWSLNWLSTRGGAPSVFELPLSNTNRYPEGITENRALPPGYSHHIAATPVPGVYLGVWVQGPEGAQDIYYRVFRK